MTPLTYKEQLLHPNWQKRRLEILSRDQFTCKSCYDTESTLHVHHKRYVKGRMAWEYPDSELVTLCWPCHEIAHEQSDELKELIAQLPLDGPACVHDALGLLAGWANNEQKLDLNRYFEVEPYCFAQGTVAQHFGECTFDTLTELAAAMASRDTFTVVEAVENFILDLKTRPTAVPPALPEGHVPL